MNLTLKRFQISRVGAHRDSRGHTRHLTEEKLRAVADEYNRRREHGQDRAPLFIDHPQEGKRHEKEPLGLADRLELAGGKLYATAYVTDKLLRLVKDKTYRAVSAGFDLLKGGDLRLNHIAFLNNPAIKDMEALNFSESESGIMEFSQPIEFENAHAHRSAHQRVCAYAEMHGVSYERAAHIVMNSTEHAYFSGSPKPRPKASVADRSAHLHKLAVDYQKRHGGSYESAVRACLPFSPDY